jgi:pimeloyl-ACP methyl ester carboxylesterase
MWKPILAAVLSLMAVIAVPAEASPKTAWQDCGDGLQCADLTVPADWARPAGPEISLRMAKLPARDQATKKGTLFLNLGGPGQQIAPFRIVRGEFAGLADFDLVTSDPRGFDESSGITCPVPSPQVAVYVFDNQPDFERYRETNHEFGVRCEQAAGPLAGHLNSWQVARDLDAIRSALGQPRLNYFGNSYGTMFAQAYAEYFPDRIGRMYLDSVIDHTTRSTLDWLKPRAAADEQNLHRMADWCTTEPTCALHGKDVLKVWDDVLARAPIPTASGGTVSAARIVARSFVSSPGGWSKVTKSLAEAEAGDATGFTIDVGARDPDLSRIMFCADFPYPTRWQDVKALETELRRTAPRIGWRQVWAMANQCGGLPATRIFPQHPFRADVRALVVNGDYDSTTPPTDGRRVASLLRGARYLQVPAGHAVYWSGNTCVRGYVDRYFSTGELPAAGTACPED